MMKNYFLLFIVVAFIAGCASYESEIVVIEDTPLPSPTASSSSITQNQQSAKTRTGFPTTPLLTANFSTESVEDNDLAESFSVVDDSGNRPSPFTGQSSPEASWYVPWDNISSRGVVSEEGLVGYDKTDNITVVDDAENGFLNRFNPTSGEINKNIPRSVYRNLQVNEDRSLSSQNVDVSADSSVISLNLKKGSSDFTSLGYVAGNPVQNKRRLSQNEHKWTFSAAPSKAPGTEEYETIEENPFKYVSQNPLSTFSVDVDTASYSNVRRFVMDNRLPHKDSVRIEELINYFTYDYPQPKNEHPFAVYTEVAQSPWNPDNKLVHIGLQGKSIPMDDLPNNNLVFLLDVSGSMKNANKLPLVKAAFKMLVNQMRPGDRVAIVTYAGSAGLALPSTSGNQKDKILEALQQLEAGGSTAGGEGIQLAYKTAQENFIPNGNNRVILATDGDFNVGISDTSELVNLIEDKRNSGIFLTVTGFGTGNLKDEKMENLADKGNGNYAYIDNLMEAKKVFVSEMGGTFFTIAKDVKLQVEFNPAIVKAYRLIGYENRLLQDRDFNDDTKDAGEIGAGHTVTALYEIVTKDSEYKLPEVDDLKYQQVVLNDKSEFAGEMMTVKLRYKEPDEDSSQLLSVTIDDQDENEASDNMKFSAAVAQYGFLLRNSSHKGNTSFETIIAMAKEAKGNDNEGYRAEFIRLVEMTELLHESQTISKSE